MTTITLNLKDKKFLKRLPGILTGRLPDRHRIRRVFVAALTYKMMQQVGEAFRIKSEGGIDDLGNAFEPLSKRTITRKSSAGFRAKHPGVIPSHIMRATDRLIKSVSEGLLTFDNYTPPKNQVVKFQAGLLRIMTNVKYAQYQFHKRPFWPENIDRWVELACEYAMKRVAEHLESLK